MTDAEHAHARIKQYTKDLAYRGELQRAWHARNGYVGVHLSRIPDGLLDRDPYPRTDDVLTAERFCDILTMLTELWARTERRER